jgi:hypothetical protein
MTLLFGTLNLNGFGLTTTPAALECQVLIRARRRWAITGSPPMVVARFPALRQG